MILSKMHKGAFIKPCPCTPGAVSCGLQNANLHHGCPFRCTYCILQAYLDTMEPVFFRNWRKIEEELAAKGPGAALRLTSGELSDSMAWEERFPIAGKVMRIMEKFPQVVFEFKTKSDRIDNILQYSRLLPNIVISWSLAPQELIEREEKGTPPLSRRLKTVSAAAEKGYKIGIHFDPIILFPEWRENYRDLVKAIARAVPVRRIAWWSLGGLRFNPELKPFIYKRKRSFLFWGELVPGFDGKYRYFKPLRLELFHFIVHEIRRTVSRDVPLYLCMEDDEAWREVLPELPPDPTAINQFIYESVFRK